MAKFEFISDYKDSGISLPVRKTKDSAGYDFCVAKDILIPPYEELMNELSFLGSKTHGPLTLDEMAKITKELNCKPTLVPTGVKAKLEPNTYLELSVRSSCPLKYWLVMANSVGIIDSDYYNNPNNEGHIYFQIINFSPFPIILKKGDIIGQGIIKPYLKTKDDIASGERIGGFGSTNG